MKTRNIFHRLNADLVQSGRKKVTWVDFCQLIPLRERKGRPWGDVKPPKEKETIPRPKAEYSNTSVRAKYGL